MQALFQDAYTQEDLLNLLRDPVIDAKAVRDFWAFINKTLPSNQNWQKLPHLVSSIRETYSIEKLKLFERIMARLTIILSKQLEPYLKGNKKPTIQVGSSYLQFGMLIYSIIGEGEEFYLNLLKKPSKASLISKLIGIPNVGLFLWAIFWYDEFVHMAGSFRVLNKMSDGSPPYLALILPGFLDPKLAEFFASQTQLSFGKECFPTLIKPTAFKEWQIIDLHKSD